MAMVSMCFQLMQDEMVAKFKWLGQKCGIGKKKEEGDASLEAGDKEKEVEKEEKPVGKEKTRPRTAIRSSRSSTSTVRS